MSRRRCVSSTGGLVAAALAALLIASFVAVLPGCSLREAAGLRAPQDATRGPGPPPAGPRVVPRTDPVHLGDDPYRGLADALAARGVGIWYEADLVTPWLEGPRAFASVVRRLGRLSSTPALRGFKIADELGYDDGISSPAAARAFLQASSRALHRVAPGAEILIDVVVPPLGCLPWRGPLQRACALEAARGHPAATTSAVDSYLRAGLVDQLDLSTSLLDRSTYAAWSLHLGQAQRMAWQHVQRLGWGDLVTLRARKALAAPGGYQGSPVDAARDARVYVDVPGSEGARAVDIWTWRQPYEGADVSLLDVALDPNPLWKELLARRGATPLLLTHATPSALPAHPVALGHECDLMATVFDQVFVAAGTG